MGNYSQLICKVYFFCCLFGLITLSTYILLNPQSNPTITPTIMSTPLTAPIVKYETLNNKDVNWFHPAEEGLYYRIDEITGLHDAKREGNGIHKRMDELERLRRTLKKAATLEEIRDEISKFLEKLITARNTHTVTTSPPPSTTGLLGTYLTIWRHYQGRFNIWDKYYVLLDSLTTLWDRSKHLLSYITGQGISTAICVTYSIYMTWFFLKKAFSEYNNHFYRLVGNWIQERKVFGIDNASENKKGLSEQYYLAAPVVLLDERESKIFVIFGSSSLINKSMKTQVVVFQTIIAKALAVLLAKLC